MVPVTSDIITEGLQQAEKVQLKKLSVCYMSLLFFWKRLVFVDVDACSLLFLDL